MRIVLTKILFLLSIYCSGQETFTMRYGCYKVFTPKAGRQPTGANNGSWSKAVDINIKVDFSVGTNKNIVVSQNGRKTVYIRNGDPLVSETPSGIKYQLITTKNGGKDYIFQYLENYNLRLMTTDDKRMIEYGCKKDFDETVGVSGERYSVVKQRAYFYNLPNSSSKRSAYLIYGEVVEALSENSGFLFVNFTNGQGKKTSGWILKSDLSQY